MARESGAQRVMRERLSLELSLTVSNAMNSCERKEQVLPEVP